MLTKMLHMCITSPFAGPRSLPRVSRRQLLRWSIGQHVQHVGNVRVPESESHVFRSQNGRLISTFEYADNEHMTNIEWMVEWYDPVTHELQHRHENHVFITQEQQV